MRIVLRQQTTGKYLARSTGWTEAESEAFSFDHCDAAIRTASQQHEKIEVVFSFANPEYDFAVPLDFEDETLKTAA